MDTRPEQLQQTARSLAAKAGLPAVELRVTAHRGIAFAEQNGSGLMVTVDDALLDASVPVQRAVIAHEIAHGALGHCAPRPLRSRIGAFLLALAGLPVLAVLVATAPHPPWWCGPLVSVDAIAMLAFLALTNSGLRRREFEADRYAARTLREPATAEFARWASERFPHGRAPRLLRPWWTHPTWEQRLAALES